MADRKVSSLAVMAAGDLDPVNDRLLVSDTSASASKAMAPSEMIRASLPYLTTAWDFTTGVLSPTVSFTRASTGWRFNSAGVLVPETTDAPRFEHDPSALTPRGMLIEEARTDLLLRSEEFDTAWVPVSATVSPNAAVAPDGTITMDKIVEGAAGDGNVQHSARQTISFTSGQYYVFSVYAKADTRSRLYLQFPLAAFGANFRAWFDLSAGTAGTNTAAASFIQPVGSGIYRCTVIAQATATTSSTLLVCLATADAGQTYIGDGASGLFVWGATCTVGDAVASYIKTVGSTVARAPDVALITNPTVLADQCWIVKGRTPRKVSGGAVNVTMQADDGSGNNRRTLRYGTDGKFHAIATVGGVEQCDLDLGAVANDTDFSVAIRWADNNFAASLNGGAIVTDLSGQNPLGLTTARVGRSSTGSYWNSTIRSIETRRTASDAELPLLAA